MNIAQHAAMDELVGFKFNVSINQEVDLFNYVLKPVRQTQVAQVPLYVALFLASQHKGIIQLPDYLTAYVLNEMLYYEKIHLNTFVQLPSKHFFNTTKRVLEACANYPDVYDQQQISELEKLRNDLMQVRFKKFYQLYKEAQSGQDLSNLTELEIYMMEVNGIQ